MGNVNNAEIKTSQSLGEREKKKVEENLVLQRSSADKHWVGKSSSTNRETLIQTALENSKNEAVRQWLRENSEPEYFSKLLDTFEFLKKQVDEEEKKNHSDNVHITFVAHGSIRRPMMAACCLLPLPNIKDVLLYSPWNCVIYADAAYGLATGHIKPEHRVFLCETQKGCKIPEEKHLPGELPNHWNSMKKAGDKMIPNITLSPLKPPEDKYWKRLEFLRNKHGPPGRNRIIIPFILPGNPSESVPFSVVTLALSLVLHESRFKATVHLAACLTDQSADLKYCEKYLQQQYSYAIDNTGMNVSANMLGGL